MTVKSRVDGEAIDWPLFLREFCEKYIGDAYIEARRREFLQLQQRQLSVFKYEKEFLRLSKYYPALISTEEEKCKRFEQGLNSDLKMFLVAHQVIEFSKLVKAVTRLEQEQKHDQGNRLQKKGFPGEYSGQKRPRDRPVSAGFIPRSERRGPSRSGFQRRQGMGSNVPSGISRVSVPPVCGNCGRSHVGACRKDSGACFRCGAPDHHIRRCPQNWANGSQASVGNAPRVQASHRPSRGGKVDSGIPRAPEDSGRVQSTTQARAYVVRAREQQDAPDVIVGKLSLLSIDVYALIDPGSTHSYICSTIASKRDMIAEQLDYDIVVLLSYPSYMLWMNIYMNV